MVTTIDFDATTIDALSVRFAPRDDVWAETGGAFEAHGQGHIEDSLELDERTQDGDLDMVLHFHVQETGISAGHTEACAKGQWTDAEGGVHTFFSCDAVCIPPGGAPQALATPALNEGHSAGVLLVCARPPKSKL
jgi:hypothetical protein